MKYTRGKKSGLKYFTYEHIDSYDPCYDPIKYIPKDWKGTAIDILKMEEVPVRDRLWVVLREDILTPKTLRLFAVYCAREALKVVKNPDPRSLKAIEVAEAYALGKATKEELESAHSAAHSTAHSSYAAFYASSYATTCANAASYAASCAADAYVSVSYASYASCADSYTRIAILSEWTRKLIEMIKEEGKKYHGIKN